MKELIFLKEQRGKNMLNLDDWQKEVLFYDGNISVRSGRQCGKSTVISIKAADYAIIHPNKLILVVAATERQAYLLFEKVLNYLMEYHKKYIKIGKDRPTKHKISLKNGSTIHCLPTGTDGYSIRGYTVDMLIADEAAFIDEAVWTAITPMLATTHGKIILLSTPHGREGYYYNSFSDPAFKTWHIRSEDCPRIDKNFLAREKATMTKIAYFQEYEAEFIDNLRRFFPDPIIKQCIVPPETQSGVNLSPKLPFFISGGDTYAGVDVARMGEDQTVIVSIKRDGDSCKMIDLEITTKTLLTETIDRIKNADKIHDYNKIYIDDGGVGSGVFDVLLRDDQTHRKVVAINNASRSLDNDDKKRKRILKDDLYANLLRLMEQSKITLWDNDELILSLKSVQYEIDLETKKMIIFGNYTHIVEALIRAAWCMNSKSLNIWVRSC
jgi:hypothetical protein